MGSLRNARSDTTPRANGPDVIVTFIGLATAWQSGVPTITPSAGSLGAITASSDVHAHATYTPPATPQTVTFTDSTDGGTATLVVKGALANMGAPPEVSTVHSSYQGVLVHENP